MLPHVALRGVGPVPRTCDYNKLCFPEPLLCLLLVLNLTDSHKRTQDSIFGDFGGRWLERKTGAVSLKVVISSPSVWRVSQAKLPSLPSNEYSAPQRMSEWMGRVRAFHIQIAVVLLMLWGSD